MESGLNQITHKQYKFLKHTHIYKYLGRPMFTYMAKFTAAESIKSGDNQHNFK